MSTFDYAQHSNVAAFYARSPEKFFEVPFGVDAQVFVPIKRCCTVRALWNQR